MNQDTFKLVGEGVIILINPSKEDVARVVVPMMEGDPCTACLCQGLQLLGEYGVTQESPRVQQHVRHTEPLVRQMALLALFTMGLEVANVLDVRKMEEEDPSTTILIQVMLAECGSHEAQNHMTQLLWSTDENVRAQANHWQGLVHQLCQTRAENLASTGTAN